MGLRLPSILAAAFAAMVAAAALLPVEEPCWEYLGPAEMPPLEQPWVTGSMDDLRSRDERVPFLVTVVDDDGAERDIGLHWLTFEDLEWRTRSSKEPLTRFEWEEWRLLREQAAAAAKPGNKRPAIGITLRASRWRETF